MKLHLIKNFKEICRLELEPTFLDEIFKKAISFCGSRKYFAFKIGTNWNELYRYKTGRRYIPALAIEDILKLINGGLQNTIGHIKKVKFNNGTPFEVIEPNLEIDFNTKQGGKVIAALLGDGYNRSNNKGAGYVNKNELLRKEFLDNLQALFKCIKLPDYSKAYKGKILQLPAFFSYVFENAGIQGGRKVFINIGAPEWLLKSNNECTICGYLQQMFDDEGHISIEKRTIDLPQSIDETNDNRIPKQLTDIFYLLQKIGIQSNNPYKIGSYEVKKEGKTYKRSRYVITISNYRELKKFLEKVGFLSAHKMDRLKKVISQPTLIQRKNKEIEKDVFSLCKKLTSSDRRITSILISKELNIGMSYSQKILDRLVKSGKIIKAKKAGAIHKANGNFLRRTYAEFSLPGGEIVV